MGSRKLTEETAMSRKNFRRLISALLAIILVFDMSALNAPIRSYAEEGAPSWPQFIEDGGSFSINSTDLTEDPFAFHVVYFQSLKGCNALLGSDKGEAPFDGIWTNAKYRRKGEKLLPAGLLGPLTIIEDY